MAVGAGGSAWNSTQCEQQKQSSMCPWEVVPRGADVSDGFDKAVAEVRLTASMAPSLSRAHSPAFVKSAAVQSRRTSATMRPTRLCRH